MKPAAAVSFVALALCVSPGCGGGQASSLASALGSAQPLEVGPARTTSRAPREGQAPEFRHAFRLGEVDDLWTAFDVEGLAPGEHVLTVDVRWDAFGYTRLEVPFIAGGDGRARVWSQLRVAGTKIENERLLGLWRVSARVERLDVSVGEVAFRLD